MPRGTPTAAPTMSVMMIHLYWSTCVSHSVAMTSTAEAISPTMTPRLAETGEPSHLMARMKPMAAAMYVKSMSCCVSAGS
jgi:hypothetical protein